MNRMKQMIKTRLSAIYNKSRQWMKYEFYSHLPEKFYPLFLSHIYQKCWHRKLDWGGQRYSEKMQREKLYNKDPLRTQLADKYAVRRWVKERIGSEYLIPLLGCWESASEIDFDSLPEQFALKTNCGSHDAVIVKDKSGLTQGDFADIRKKMRKALKYNFAFQNGFELHYIDIPPRIIAEELIADKKDGDLKDYKFLCFDGIPHYFWIDGERYTHHSRNVYDMDWNRMPWTPGNHLPPIPYEIVKPKNWERMVEIVKALSAGFPHVRVDLYNVDGRILFGEMTFTSGSGFLYLPPEIDLMLGELWHTDG